jgi:ribosomal protein L37AE/L43A
MNEAELRQIAEDPKSLTGFAIEALKVEFARRGLEVNLEVSPPELEAHPDVPNLVILRHFRDLPEALLAKGGLESAGIECFFDDDNIVRLDWLISNAVGGIKLLVRPEDVDAANQILKEGIPQAFEVAGIGEYNQPQCPECESMDVSFIGRNKIAASGLVGAGLSNLVNRNCWNCNSCGHQWSAPSDEVSDTQKTSEP